jgi:RNA polymerase sigma-70 factor, ECF subfamily
MVPDSPAVQGVLRDPTADWLKVGRFFRRGCLVADESGGPVTQLLVRVQAGDSGALDRLLPLVYDELQRLARRHIRKERRNHTLQSTALVHEAYLRLVGQAPSALQTRTHFFAVAANLMREILVDHARRHKSAKRGGGAYRVTLDDALEQAPQADLDLVALDEALLALARVDPAKARLVELRYFGGLTIEESAAVLGLSLATVKRHWSLARAWLYREISQTSAQPP